METPITEPNKDDNETNLTIDPDYIPVIYSITVSDKDKDNIFDFDEEPKFSKNIDYPKFSLGFQHFIHQSKTKMEITKEFENKKKV